MSKPSRVEKRSIVAVLTSILYYLHLRSSVNVTVATSGFRRLGSCIFHGFICSLDGSWIDTLC